MFSCVGVVSSSLRSVGQPSSGFPLFLTLTSACQAEDAARAQAHASPQSCEAVAAKPGERRCQSGDEQGTKISCSSDFLASDSNRSILARELLSFYCRSAVLWFSGSLRQPRLVWIAMIKSSLTSLIFCFGTFLLREPQLWLGCLLGELRSKGRPHCAVCFCSGFAGWLLAVPLKVHSPHFGSCHSGRRKQSCVDRPQTTSLSQALATNLRTQRIWYCGCSIAGTLF